MFETETLYPSLFLSLSLSPGRLNVLIPRRFTGRQTMLTTARVLQGPGDYDPKLRPSYHLEMPGSSPFMSGVPKSDTRIQAGPGPGQYAHHSPLGTNISASNVPYFSSSSQRGAWLRNDQVRRLAPRKNLAAWVTLSPF